MKHVARLLRRLANRLDPQAPQLHVTINARDTAAEVIREMRNAQRNRRNGFGAA